MQKVVTFVTILPEIAPTTKGYKMGKAWYAVSNFTCDRALDSISKIEANGGTVEQIVRDGGSYNIFYSIPTTRLEYLVVKVKLSGEGYVTSSATSDIQHDATKVINDYVSKGYSLISQTMHADIVLITFSIEVPLEQ